MSCGGYSIQEWLDGKKDAGEDVEGDPVVCGEGACEAIKKGPAKEGETSAKVWGMPVSANTVSVVLLAKDAGVGDMAMLNLMEGKHLEPEFLKKNPFHQIPTYEGSDGFCMGESNATLRFIAANYLKEAYPENAKTRGRIDWALDTLATGCYKKAGAIFYPVLGFLPPPEDQQKANDECTTILNEYATAFLEGSKFVNGDALSIAEYKFASYLFTLSQPAVEAKTGFKLSERMSKYLADIMEAIKSTSFMEEGDMCLKGFLASKA